MLAGHGGWVLPPPGTPTRGEATGGCIRLRRCVGQGQVLRGGFRARPQWVEPFWCRSCGEGCQGIKSAFWGEPFR